MRKINWDRLIWWECIGQADFVRVYGTGRHVGTIWDRQTWWGCEVEFLSHGFKASRNMFVGKRIQMTQIVIPLIFSVLTQAVY